MKSEKKITEAPSHYDDLELMSTEEILLNINREDQKIAGMVAQVIPQLQLLVDQATTRMQKGGRLFYIGAGTSGRL
ncbi:MAG: N-acetylmuramic acid 6-phosphate etherase, partial [Bacteroidota bacterium]